MEDFPPAFSQETLDRELVQTAPVVAHNARGEQPGIHLLIEGKSYFLERAIARRMARQILFKEET